MDVPIVAVVDPPSVVLATAAPAATAPDVPPAASEVSVRVPDAVTLMLWALVMVAPPINASSDASSVM